MGNTLGKEPPIGRLVGTLDPVCQFLAIACCPPLPRSRRARIPRGAAACQAPAPSPPAALLARVPSLLREFGRGWVVCECRRTALSLGVELQDPRRRGTRRRDGGGGGDSLLPLGVPSLGRYPYEYEHVHVWMCLSATLGVVNCGFFTTPQPWSVISHCGPVPNEQHEPTKKQKQKQANSELRFVATCDLEIFVIDNSGKKLTKELGRKLHLLCLNTKWMLVVSTHLTLTVMRIDWLDTSGQVPHVKVPCSRSYTDGQFFGPRGDEVLLFRGTPGGEMASFVDLVSTFSLQCIVVTREIEVPCTAYSALWLGDTLCTLHRTGKQSQLYNTGSRQLHTLEPGTGMCYVYHVSDLSKPCCTIDTQEALFTFCSHDRGIVVSVVRAQQNKVELRDALTGIIVAVFTSPYLCLELEW
ncbi:hypothetical protein Pelo_555 [Pelomyxa schiedti]|nr:hypothetical protein Pelo_555 [Pelomyxa schiedti]